MRASWIGWKQQWVVGLAAAAVALLVAVPHVGAAETRVNLNDATVEELTSLPGIGPSRARAIVERREEAPFDSADELTDVPGIGPAVVEKLRDLVEVVDPERRAKADKRR